MIIVYTPCKDEKEAEKIAEALLNEKLVACANILPSKSLYFWQGKLQKENEAILILKTTKEKFTAAEKKIKELHSYELPCILKIEGKANEEFEKWVEKNTG
ncbi:divalent-cation tolerance protein CutA [Candidatus Woesearchaeota archaeon]|nr:divalent-cation tolerance protein CutA [Candidatus Woesearchaeota archaeon]